MGLSPLGPHPQAQHHPSAGPSRLQLPAGPSFEPQRAWWMANSPRRPRLTRKWTLGVWRLAPLNRDGNRPREAEGPGGHLVPKEQQADPSDSFQASQVPRCCRGGGVISEHPIPPTGSGAAGQSPGQPGQCPSRQTWEVRSGSALGPWSTKPPQASSSCQPISASPEEADAQPASAQGPASPRQGTRLAVGTSHRAEQVPADPSHHFTQNRRWDAGRSVPWTQPFRHRNSF